MLKYEGKKKKKKEKKKKVDGRRIERRTFRSYAVAKRTLYHWVTRPFLTNTGHLLIYEGNIE